MGKLFGGAVAATFTDQLKDERPWRYPTTSRIASINGFAPVHAGAPSFAVRPSILALAFLSLAGSAARGSEPVQLSCAGKMTATVRDVSEDYTISLTVDLTAKTVTAGSYGTVPILDGIDGDTVVFMANKGATHGLSSGTLNRITGAVSVHVITLTDGLYKFYGVCKRAQKLF
jgi:hypothetical protein